MDYLQTRARIFIGMCLNKVCVRDKTVCVCRVANLRDSLSEVYILLYVYNLNENYIKVKFMAYCSLTEGAHTHSVISNNSNAYYIYLNYCKLTIIIIVVGCVWLAFKLILL